MQVDFVVHGVAKTTTTAQAEINGETISATVPCLEVELTTADARHGSLVLRFVGSQVKDAEAIFTPDAVIPWTLPDAQAAGFGVPTRSGFGRQR